MRKPIQDPIILHEHGDVSVFASVKDCEEYVEPIDVLNDEYDFFDAVGQKLIAIVNHEEVQLTPLQPPQYAEDTVASILRRYLSQVDPSESHRFRDAPLALLVECLEKFHREGI